MSTSRIVALIGTYRKFGIIDQAVDAVLQAAEAEGADTAKIYLVDHPIEFCQNCRICAQEPGETRGKCVIDDDMTKMLDAVDNADALVLAAPVNFGDVTAITRRFLERLTCYAYWPWDKNLPEQRIKRLTKRALLVTSTGMPGIMARFFTRSMGTLKEIAKQVGAKPVGELYIGLAAQSPDQQLIDRELNRARKLGRKLARG